MPATIAFLLILLAGFALGIVFYGGLWLTVRALPKSRHALLIALASFWGRTGLVVAGLLLAMDASWQRALICLLGFAIARIVLARWVPPHNHFAGRGVI
jgi:F1F0 ATPase subunit 2